MKGDVQRELPFDTTESETLSMRRRAPRGNRETPETSSPHGGGERLGKVTRTFPGSRTVP